MSSQQEDLAQSLRELREVAAKFLELVDPVLSKSGESSGSRPE